MAASEVLPVLIPIVAALALVVANAEALTRGGR